jgi:hypothetical protein
MFNITLKYFMVASGFVGLLYLFLVQRAGRIDLLLDSLSNLQSSLVFSFLISILKLAHVMCPQQLWYYYSTTQAYHIFPELSSYIKNEFDVGSTILLWKYSRRGWILN